VPHGSAPHGTATPVARGFALLAWILIAAGSAVAQTGTPAVQASEAPAAQVREGSAAAPPLSGTGPAGHLAQADTGLEDETAADPEKAVLLPEILVTGRPIREETRLDRLGGLVTVVGSRQIRDLNALDLPTALRRLPGVVISRYNLVGGYGGGDGGAIYLRGLGSGRPGAEVSTLFDGIPRFVGVWTHPIMDALPIGSSGAIEVRKGAQPVLQGNMAFGSVNLVPLRRTTPGFQTSLEGTFGRYETATGFLRHGGRQGDFDYFLSAGSNRSDGQRDHASGRNASVYGRAGYRLSLDQDIHLDMHLQAQHTDGKVEDPGSATEPWPLGDPAFRIPTFRTDTEIYLATAAHRAGPLSGTIKLYMEDGRLDWLQWDSPAGGQPVQSFTTMTNYLNYGFRLQESIRLPARIGLMLGYDQDFYGGETYTKVSSGNGTRSAHDFLNRAPYATVTTTLPLDLPLPGGHAKGWRLTPSIGTRFNDSRYFGEDWGWQAGVAAERGSTRLNAQYSRAFNLPGVYVAAMYDGWNRPGEWKTLDAEILDHYEVGLKIRPIQRLEAEFSAFYDEVGSRLRWVPPVVPPPPPFQPPRFTNQGRAVNRGMETTISVETGPASVFAGLTLMRPAAEDLPNVPDWALTAGVNTRLTGALGLNLDASWTDEQTILNPRFAAPGDFDSPTARVDRYFVLNGRLGYSLQLAGSVQEIFVACENLTGERYEFRPGYLMPRQVWMTGLKVELQD